MNSFEENILKFISKALGNSSCHIDSQCSQNYNLKSHFVCLN